MFNKKGRPLKKSIIFFAEQTLAHGWIIARISVIFKLTERALAMTEGVKSPREWHSFVAGALAGYLIMARDNGYKSMKKQINMAIGIRTIYAITSYLLRKGMMLPLLDPAKDGYEQGTALFYTIMWGFVMWHWRHETAAAPGEMNVAQVKQMNFIYNDFSLEKGWLDGNHLYWLAALLVVKNFMQP